MVKKGAFQVHLTNPMSCDQVESKFHNTASTRLDEDHGITSLGRSGFSSHTPDDFVTLLTSGVAMLLEQNLAGGFCPMHLEDDSP